MRDRLGGGGGHVASGASRSLRVVLANDPGLGTEIHVSRSAPGGECNTVLGLVLDLDLRMIRTHVAASAVLRRPDLGDVKRVTCMARRASAS